MLLNGWLALVISGCVFDVVNVRAASHNEYTLLFTVATIDIATRVNDEYIRWIHHDTYLQYSALIYRLTVIYVIYSGCHVLALP